MARNTSVSEEFREQIEYLADRAGEERARVAEESRPARIKSPIRKFIWFGVVAAAFELALLGYFSTRESRELQDHVAEPNPLSVRQDCDGESFRLTQKIIAYSLANGGRAPASLDELIPAFLDKPPVDPITKLPLKYIPTGNAFRIECPPQPLTR